MSEPAAANTADAVPHAPLRVLGMPIHLERLTYTTIVLMSVLVVYDEWSELTTFMGMTLVIIGPILAIAIAHGFSEALDEIADYRRPLTWSEWRALLLSQLQVLFAAVPPLVVVGLGFLSPLDADGTINVLIWTAAVTLIALAAVAAYRAGLRGWRLVLAACVGGVIGLLVISLQILLKPH